MRDVLCAEERDKIISYKIGETYSRARNQALQAYLVSAVVSVATTGESHLTWSPYRTATRGMETPSSGTE